MKSKLLMASAATAMSLAPAATLAQENGVASRTSTPISAGSNFAGQSDLYWVLGVVAAIGAVILVTTELDDDEPVSP